MVITFKSDIKKRKKFFTPESFSHPAKMSLGLLLWVVGKYTKPGETILDPMFGAGSTMLAARYGRNVIGVELEQKFVDLAKGNWDKVVSLPKTKFGLGSCHIILGDARDLEGLLVDSVLFSPPYEATFNEKQHTLSGIAKRDPSMRTEVGGYSGKVEAIISSPPYAGAEQVDNRKTYNKTIMGLKGMGQAQREHYTEDNIGNLRGDTYLEAMLQVYQQCYKVLKPNGLMILVTKDFIRKGQRILLSIDTIALCEQAGFVYEDWHQRKLTQQSFWRILHQKKHPEVEKLETEDILVFRKSSGKGEIDCIVTSPPYAIPRTSKGSLNAQEGRVYQDTREGRRGTTWEFSGQEELGHPSPDNIANLSYGSIDTIISSPPFAGNTGGLRSARNFKYGDDPVGKRMMGGIKGGTGDSPFNIDRLPYDGARINEEWIKSRMVVK